jgi:hypothetical protein
MLLYGGIGALVDYLKVGRTTIFRAHQQRSNASAAAAPSEDIPYCRCPLTLEKRAFEAYAFGGGNDPLWNGALIGAGAFALTAEFFGGDARAYARTMLAGAAIGALVDGVNLRRGQRVYPILSSQSKGVAITFQR